MQLSGLIDKLQGLLSKAVLVSALLPLICFALVNGAILAALFPTQLAGVRDALLRTPTTATFSAALGVPGLICAAFVLSSFNLTLRQILEGKYLPPFLGPWLHGREGDRLDRLKGKLDTCRKVGLLLRENADLWITDLFAARTVGAKTGQCTYRDSDPSLERRMKKWFAALRKAHRRDGPVSRTELKILQDAVEVLKTILRNHDANLLDNDQAQDLDERHRWLGDYIGRVAIRADQAYIDAYNDKEFNFSRFTLAATRMGNIAESVRSYARSRYSMNLDFVWTRLQYTFQQNNTFCSSVQDAKIQLDLMIASFWLSAVTTVFWIIFIPWVAATWVPVCGVWSLGLPLTLFWYFAAVQAYLSFADLLRGSVDLFRLELLKGLKIPAPANSDEENRIWNTLNQKLCYGEDVFIPYTTSAE